MNVGILAGILLIVTGTIMKQTRRDDLEDYGLMLIICGIMVTAIFTPVREMIFGG